MWYHFHSRRRIWVSDMSKTLTLTLKWTLELHWHWHWHWHWRWHVTGKPWWFPAGRSAISPKVSDCILLLCALWVHTCSIPSRLTSHGCDFGLKTWVSNRFKAKDLNIRPILRKLRFFIKMFLMKSSTGVSLNIAETSWFESARYRLSVVPFVYSLCKANSTEGS